LPPNKNKYVELLIALILCYLATIKIVATVCFLVKTDKQGEKSPIPSTVIVFREKGLLYKLYLSLI